MCEGWQDGASLSFRALLKCRDFCTGPLPERSSAFDSECVLWCGRRELLCTLHLHRLVKQALEDSQPGRRSGPASLQKLVRGRPASCTPVPACLMTRSIKQQAPLHEVATHLFSLVRQEHMSMPWAKSFLQKQTKSKKSPCLGWLKAAAPQSCAGSRWLAKMVCPHTCVL